MNRRMICRVLGLILACEAVLLILPTVAGLCYGESVTHFLITMALSGVLGFLLTRVKPYSDVIYAKDGFVVTTTHVSIPTTPGQRGSSENRVRQGHHRRSRQVRELVDVPVRGQYADLFRRFRQQARRIRGGQRVRQ